MKHFYLFGLALLLSLSAYAQRPIGGATTNAAGGGGTGPVEYIPAEETPWSHVADSMLYYLDKSQIPSGILYDRVVPYAALPYFDRFQADTSSVAHLRQAYLELWLAAYNRQAFALTPSQLREKADALVRGGTVPLAVLDYRLHYLDTMAVYRNQLVLQNGLYRDVPGRSSSPYTERLLTLAAPLAASVTQQAQFQVAPALLFGNRGRTVSSLLVNFDNGAAPVACLPGQLVSVSYPTPGKKLLRFTVNFTDGSTAQARARLTVLPQPPASRRIFRLLDIEARDAFQDYTSSRSLYGKGEVLVVLNNPTSESEGAAYKLRNPVIVMDGFDPKDEGSLNQDDGSNKSIYTQLAEARILDLLTFLQRDLVILNFPVSQRRQLSGGMTAENIDGGTDYVERNAYVLETLLNTLKPMTYVNPATGVPDKFAVLGPSMGGLISRYALAHMEKQQQLLADAGQPANPWWDHNTSEWISFDTPHMGANIPLGDQYLLKFFGDKQAARDNLEQRLDAVAAKQFLVAHHTYTGTNVGGAPGFRDRFMRALRDNGERNSFGYPVHLRRVALADGKLNGLLPANSDGTPCGKILDLNIYTRFLPGVGATVLGFFGFSYKTTSPTTIATSAIRFLPDANTNCLVFYGRTSETRGLSWGRVGPTAIGIKSVVSGPQGSWDLAPGGIRSTQQGLHDQLEAAGNGEDFKVSVTDLHPNHCFIPTVSALGFQYQSMASYQNTSSLPNPYTNLLTRGSLVCNNEIPFDDFYAPASGNLAHVTTDAGAAAFLLRELTPRVATPVFASAPNVVCPNGTIALAVAEPCQLPGRVVPITYTWTFPQGGLQFAPGSPTSGPAITVQPAPGAAINNEYGVRVTAARAGATTSAAITQYVSVSYGNVQVEMLTPATEVIQGQAIDFIAVFAQASGPLGWSVSVGGAPGGANRLSSPYGPNAIRYKTTRSGMMVVNVEAVSACDPNVSVEGTNPNLLIVPGQRREATTPAAYPNPADDVLTLATPEAPEAAAPRTAVLYNGQGREVRRTRAGEARLATADLPTGLYYLMTEQNGQVTRTQIRVQH